MEIIIQEGKEYENTKVIIQCPEMNEEIMRIIAGLRVYDRKVTGIRDEGTYIVEAGRILYLDTVDKKTFFYTENDVYETPLKLYELEERLGKADFFRASKSSIINFNQIRSLRPDFGGKMLVEMKNGERLYVSRQYVPVLKKKLGL